MISIVIPTYHRADLLSRLLNSIHAQIYNDFEVIVVDDASPNVEDYLPVIEAARRRFRQFTYLRLESNSGAPRARNVGISQARGEWLALVDDDDEWLPEKLELQYAIVKHAPPNVGLIYTWTRALGSKGQLLYESTPDIEGSVERYIFTTNFIMSPSVMVRRQVFVRVGGFDEDLPSCQDWDMWARILGAGYECRVVRRVLSIYHSHGQPSVGLSPLALEGYRSFLKNHWRSIIRHTSPLNWIRKLLLFIKAVWKKTEC
jgi:glycosyltransferase involved in cell wall biosynthesis